MSLYQIELYNEAKLSDDQHTERITDEQNWLTQMSIRVRKQTMLNVSLPNGKKRRITSPNNSKNGAANASDQKMCNVLEQSRPINFFPRQTMHPRALDVGIRGGPTRPHLSEHPD